MNQTNQNKLNKQTKKFKTHSLLCLYEFKKIQCVCVDDNLPCEHRHISQASVEPFPYVSPPTFATTTIKQKRNTRMSIYELLWLSKQSKISQ
jgi:hypothetical protein